jgi:hypothetical protein
LFCSSNHPSFPVQNTSMVRVPDSGSRVDGWLAALDERHLADLTPSEAARALRALSSCYVERRAKLGEGAALGTAGKRAAFALFYAPLHFLTTREIVRALAAAPGIAAIEDLGCGTGSAGAAWALEAGAGTVAGVDRNPWAVGEANWTYRRLGLSGRAVRQDLTGFRFSDRPGTGILAAYAINELPDPARTAMLSRLLQARARGATVLLIEPIARRMSPWWAEWEAAFQSVGGRADEWRFSVELPKRQRDLGRAAGLTVRELTARSLFARGT